MKVLPEQLSQLCRPFGVVLSVVILHGRGQALVEMDSKFAVDAFLIWCCQDTDDNKKDVMINASTLTLSHSQKAEYEKISKLKFKSWTQSASAQRGRPRGDRNQRDSGSSITGADSSSSSSNIIRTNNNSSSSSSSSSIAGSDDKTHSSNDEMKVLTSNDDLIQISNTVMNQINIKDIHKQVGADVILREVGRCLKAVIKEIVYQDSEERMRARKMKKKQHKNFIEEMKKDKEKEQEESGLNNDNSNITSHNESNAYSNHDININQGRNVPQKSIEKKSEYFLSNWKSNKYRIKKEEMSLICWHYVASGGNIEFCPYHNTSKKREIEIVTVKEEEMEMENEREEEKETEIEIGTEVEAEGDNSNERITRTHTISQVSESSLQKEHSSEQRFLRKEHSLKKHNRSASSRCPAYHISRPVTEIPILLRVFEVDDFFPIARYVRTSISDPFSFLFVFFLVFFLFDLLILIIHTSNLLRIRS
jgi:hypothetical protein